MPSRKRYVVQLVDDHHMVRVGLMALAQAKGQHRIEWIESSNLDDALATYTLQPTVDLVLLDLNLPDSQGLQGLKHFLRLFPAARVAVFSATEDEFIIRQAIALGAIGFVCKSAFAEATLVLVESLLIGASSNAEMELMGMKTSPAQLRQEREVLASLPVSVRSNKLDITSALSPTQLKVLELVLEGMSNQEIASATKLALGTVKNTVSAVMLTLDVNSRSHLISVFR